MSGDSTSQMTPPRQPTGLDWALMIRQVRGIMRLELGKNMLSRRALALYLMAFGPVLLVLLWVMVPIEKDLIGGTSGAAGIFANLFPFYLRVSIFLSALFLFMSLFRSEILERSLHYYLLTPIRREVLTAGKYLAALLAMTVTYVISTALLFLLSLSHWGLGELGHYMSGPGLGNLLSYLGIAVLACAGYGAVFLLAGQFFRNPVIPAAVLWGWEFINFLLPPLLKKISVVHYLRSLYPIPVLDGPFAVFADPTPAWISVPGMLIFTALVLVAAGWRARRMEISYGGEDRKSVV